MKNTEFLAELSDAGFVFETDPAFSGDHPKHGEKLGAANPGLHPTSAAPDPFEAPNWFATGNYFTDLYQFVFCYA